MGPTEWVIESRIYNRFLIILVRQLDVECEHSAHVQYMAQDLILITQTTNVYLTMEAPCLPSNQATSGVTWTDGNSKLRAYDNILDWPVGLVQ